MGGMGNLSIDSLRGDDVFEGGRGSKVAPVSFLLFFTNGFFLVLIFDRLSETSLRVGIRVRLRSPNIGEVDGDLVGGVPGGEGDVLRSIATEVLNVGSRELMVGRKEL